MWYIGVRIVGKKYSVPEDALCQKAKYDNQCAMYSILIIDFTNLKIPCVGWLGLGRGSHKTPHSSQSRADACIPSSEHASLWNDSVSCLIYKPQSSQLKL